MMERFKVLLVEDNLRDANLIQEMLVGADAAVFDLERVGYLSHGLEHLESNHFDLVLLDLSLPDSVGFETFAQMKERAPGLPIIVLTDLDDEKLAVRAVREGAQDYLFKGQVDGRLLTRSMWYAIERKRAEKERRRTNEALRQRTIQLESLREVTLAITGELELDKLLQAIVSKAVDLMGGAAGSLSLHRPGRDVLDFTIQIGLPSAPSNSVINYKEGLAGKVWEKGEAIIVDNYECWEGCSERWCEHVREMAEVGVPVRWGDEFLGVLEVMALPPRNFSPDDVELLKLFAAHAAIAIQNARLHRRLGEYAQRLEERVEERTAELQAQHAQLEAILHNIAEGIIVTDLQGNILQTNAVAEIWLDQALSPEDAARLEGCVQRLAQCADEHPEEVLELAGRDLELRVASISGQEAGSAAAVVAVHDISQLKALDRMKNRFVSNVSHELRTPITAIKLLAHQMRTRPEVREEFLELLIKEADHQVELVEAILEISRVDAGRLDLEARPTLLNELTHKLVNNHQMRVQRKGLKLKYHPAKSDLMVQVDPQRMTQVLDNLVMNALRYTPEGGQITISTAAKRSGGHDWATVSVEDTGIGIPEDELPHIFDRFFRGEHPRQMQVSGTGLGLAIVKEIVDLHNGKITVESEAGQGSLFTIWLPAKQIKNGDWFNLQD